MFLSVEPHTEIPPASHGRRPTPAPRGQEEGERPALRIPQQDGGARLSLSRQPCGDRWLLGKGQSPSEHPQTRRPTAQHPNQQETPRSLRSPPRV